MKNRKSGLCLGISGASTANGAQAAQFPCDGSAEPGLGLHGVTPAPSLTAAEGRQGREGGARCDRSRPALVGRDRRATVAGQTFSGLTAVGAWPGSVATGSNSITLLMSFVVDIAMFVTRSRIASTTTGTRCSAASFFACSKAAPSSFGSVTRIALQPRPSATLTWSTP